MKTRIVLLLAFIVTVAHIRNRYHNSASQGPIAVSEPPKAHEQGVPAQPAPQPKLVRMHYALEASIPTQPSTVSATTTP